MLAAQKLLDVLLCLSTYPLEDLFLYLKTKQSKTKNPHSLNLIQTHNIEYGLKFLSKAQLFVSALLTGGDIFLVYLDLH